MGSLEMNYLAAYTGGSLLLLLFLKLKVMWRCCRGNQGTVMSLTISVHVPGPGLVLKAEV